MINLYYFDKQIEVKLEVRRMILKRLDQVKASPEYLFGTVSREESTESLRHDLEDIHKQIDSLEQIKKFITLAVPALMRIHE
jgi:hypothetical protein